MAKNKISTNTALRFIKNIKKECIIALQHGDKMVSAKKFAKITGFKKLIPADAKTALKWSGYQFGGTSPFGTKKEMKVYAEETIFELKRIYINGGGRGIILGISSKSLENSMKIEKVNFSQ